MTHPTQPDRDDASTPPDRETVARVIDPEAFVSLDDHRAWAAGFVARHRLGSDGLEDIARSNYSAREPGRVAALAKADAILALWPTGEGVSGGVVDVGGLVEALTHAISICPSLDTNGYITEKSEAIKAVKAALRGRGEGGAGEGQGVTTETERGDGSLPVPSPQQYHAGDASRRAAFRAGWYVNAAEPPDQTEEYLAACEAADYRDYCASQDAKQ